MTTTALGASREQIESRTFGRGIAVRPLGLDDMTRADIVFDGGKLGAVSGREALIQDLTLAFCTGLGTDPLNTGFGFDGARLMATEDNPQMLRERLRAAAAIVTASDPRVARVIDVQVEGAAEAGTLAGTDRPTILVIRVKFDLSIGGSAEVTIEGVATNG